MTYAKIFFVLVFSLSCLSGIAAQKTDKLLKKATEKVEELNQRIEAGGLASGLTEAQQERIVDIYQQMFKDIRQAKKKGGSEEEKKESVKAVRKQAMQTIIQDVLSKEQRKARRLGKKG